MSNQSNINGVRSNTLDRIARSKRNLQLTLIAGAILELIYLLALLLKLDRSNKTHLLIFTSTFAAYTLLAIGLVLLGMFLNQKVLLILRAIEMLDERMANEKKH